MPWRCATANPPARRAPIATLAYANAMRDVAKQLPGRRRRPGAVRRRDAQSRPWNQWTRDGQPQPGTLELVGALERALARSRTHAGACHFYIHAVEASETPERALPCAERLPQLMPGAGHVVHMPAHVYLRVGRYEEAARANIAAVEADQRYFAARKAAPGIYPMFYAPHNLHFLWSTYLLSGPAREGADAARALAGRVESGRGAATAVARGVPDACDPHPGTVRRLGRRPRGTGAAGGTALRDRACGTTRAGRVRGPQGRGVGRARADRFARLSTELKDDLIIILNPAPALLTLAAEVLAGEIAAKAAAIRRSDRAFPNRRGHGRRADLRRAAALVSLGAQHAGEALLEAGRPRMPRPRSATISATSARPAGRCRAGAGAARDGQAQARPLMLTRRFKAAWKYADVPAGSGEQLELTGMGR